MTRAERFSKLPKLKPRSRILLLTHNDMDGSGPVIILKSLFQDVSVEHCTNSNMSTIIHNRVTDPNARDKYDAIIVCDISCNTHDAAVIDRCTTKPDLLLFDHHRTAKLLNGYSWAVVSEIATSDSSRMSYYSDVETLAPLSSATALLYDYIQFYGLDETRFIDTDKLRLLVHMISAWDTWEWHDVFGDDESYKNLNSLFHIWGAERFERKMCERVRNANLSIFTAEDKEWLDVERDRVNEHLEYIKTAINTGTITAGGKVYTAAFCFTDKYLSDTFICMRTEYPDLDLYIINYGRGMSVRSVKPEISTADFVKAYGGGGHPGAGGFSIPLAEQVSYMENVLHGTITLDSSLAPGEHKTGFFATVG